MFGAHFLVNLNDDGGLGRQLDLVDDLFGVIKALGIEINGGQGVRSVAIKGKSIGGLQAD
jgi:hypothetical protein